MLASATLYIRAMRTMTCVAVMAMVVCACGKTDGGGKQTWLDAKLVATTVDATGVKVHVDIPQGLPENKESIVGPDWMVKPVGSPGPRITIRQRNKTFNTADELARDVEPDATRSDLVEVTKQALADGRLLYVSTVKGNRHLDATVWIPLDETRGVEGTCHWYAGSDAKDSKTPDKPLLDWLTKICDSIKVEK